MAMDLSTLGAGLTEPMAKIVNNLIDKISLAIGWIAKPHGIREAKLDAQKSLIKEIAERKDIDPFTRMTIINNLGKTDMEYRNQLAILETSLQYLEPGAAPEKMDDDWIAFFFDKTKNVSDEKMRLIWAKLLANEVNSPMSYSRSLIHILSIMSFYDSSLFMKILPFCMKSSNDRIFTFIYLWTQSNTLKIEANITQYYDDHGVNYETIKLCERLGLLVYDDNGLICSVKDPFTLHYNRNVIKIKSSNNRMMYGNVALSPEGNELYNICEKVYRDDFIHICVNVWEKLNYQVEII